METLDKNAPIGVFDSGVGGLTVAREIIRQLPNESIVYFGDTGRVPYGTRSKETIVKYTHDDIKFLLSRDVKMIVIACGTASSAALPEIRNEYGIPIFGVVDAGNAVDGNALCVGNAVEGGKHLANSDGITLSSDVSSVG